MKKLGTYIVDFLLCLVLPPAGVLKIAHRQNKRRQELVRGGQKVLMVAVAMIIVVNILHNDEAMLKNPFFYAYGAAGLMGIFFGVRMILQGQRYKKYETTVKTFRVYTAFEIGEKIKLPQETVIKDLVAMLEGGFFADYTYDSAARALRRSEDAMAKVPSAAVVCQSCGASVTVYEGRRNRCEYCGSALNYEG
jgi:hypothetical protein